MFTLPPLPPKDYTIRNVTQIQKSVQEFTPNAIPRITQTNLGKFCAPIQYQENEKLANVNIDVSVNPQLLEKWADRARAFWVDKPGKNDYFLHDLYRKYSMQVAPSYDVRFKHNERVFYRSFKYELDCADEERVKKLHKKTHKERKDECEKQSKIENDNILDLQKKKDTTGVVPCKQSKPFWWKNGHETCKNKLQIPEFKLESVVDFRQFRWQEEPNLMDFGSTDACKRRRDMSLINMPFRSEACNWYYRNYPPPNHPITPKKIL